MSILYTYLTTMLIMLKLFSRNAQMIKLRVLSQDKMVRSHKKEDQHKNNFRNNHIA